MITVVPFSARRGYSPPAALNFLAETFSQTLPRISQAPNRIVFGPSKPAPDTGGLRMQLRARTRFNASMNQAVQPVRCV
jgi:hypothetical protein